MHEKVNNDVQHWYGPQDWTRSASSRCNTQQPYDQCGNDVRLCLSQSQGKFCKAQHTIRETGDEGCCNASLTNSVTAAFFADKPELYWHCLKGRAMHLSTCIHAAHEFLLLVCVLICLCFDAGSCGEAACSAGAAVQHHPAEAV